MNRPDHSKFDAQTRTVGANLSAEHYHADDTGDPRPSLSASIAHTLVTHSPRHAWAAHPRLNPDFEREDDDRFDVGTVAHALLLQGESLVDVVDATDWRTKAAQEQRAASRAAGRIALLPDQWLRVQTMIGAAREQIAHADVDPPLFTEGAPEQTLVWEDEGVLCRARLDWLRHDLAAIDDLKTTKASAHPRVWSRRTMFAIGADIQIAWYLRGLGSLYPETRGQVAWRYVVVETFPPFALSVVEPDAGILEVGRLKVEEALATWKRCLESDEWPAYPRRAFRAELPAWVEMEWLEGRDAA